MFCKNSAAYRFLAVFWKGVKVNFRHCFLVRISEAENLPNREFLNNSLFIRVVLNIYKASIGKAGRYVTGSHFVDMAGQVKKTMALQPVKMAGAVIIIVILTGIFLAVLFHKKIELSGWAVRMFFLIIALDGVFCNAGWEDLKATSFVLRWINNHCKA